MAVTDQTKRILDTELKRLKAERKKLEDAIVKLEEAMKAVGSTAVSRVTRKPATKRKPAAKKTTAKKTTAKKASKEWTPTGRAKQALEQIKKNPGITAGEVAKKLKLKNSTAIYPAINKLKANKFIKKSGKGYRAAS